MFLKQAPRTLWDFWNQSLGPERQDQVGEAATLGLLLQCQKGGGRRREARESEGRKAQEDEGPMRTTRRTGRGEGQRRPLRPKGRGTGRGPASPLEDVPQETLVRQRCARGRARAGPRAWAVGVGGHGLRRQRQCSSTRLALLPPLLGRGLEPT